MILALPLTCLTLDKLARLLEPHFSPSVKFRLKNQDFSGGTVVENLPANAGDTGSIPALGRFHMPRSN